jgi:hypothetical protein
LIKWLFKILTGLLYGFDTNFTALKKLIAILLLGLYGFSVSGASVQLHYCCGSIASVSVGYSEADGCGDMAMQEMAGCCFDDQVKMDVDDDQGASVAAPLPAAWLVMLAPVEQPSYEVIQYPASDKQPVSVRGSPPPLPDCPIYLRNCVFRN